MSIKPVNYQVMLPKASEVSKINTDEHQKNHMLQQQQMSTLQNKAENNIKQVHSRDSASEAKVREKREREQNDKRKDGKDKKDKDSKKKDAANTKRTSTIDIRL